MHLTPFDCTDRLEMETKSAPCSVILEVLNKNNYRDWSVRVKTYLIAQELWDIIEGTTEPPRQADDEAVFKTWNKKNFMALHVIQNSCGPDAFYEIKKISSAKVAWDTLAEQFYLPKNTNSGVPLASLSVLYLLDLSLSFQKMLNKSYVCRLQLYLKFLTKTIM